MPPWGDRTSLHGANLSLVDVSGELPVSSDLPAVRHYSCQQNGLYLGILRVW